MGRGRIFTYEYIEKNLLLKKQLARQAVTYVEASSGSISSVDSKDHVPCGHSIE